ncbi:MAG: invasion associated locus B family protein [Alphaproteobacteria bacterium]|nr:invasion associated locus B family protein [Alphaproteobacteria bacterium]MDE1986412.1 invasion associated locus B family protein [Alphaproteobacteria bacterium]MDE2162776.1 invasion associated locus B family protein [Alphaproteobacteria bacterium]MDE2266287.1 invasion associated locus B family protein [Alphaproteobacteria bacterium]MDE2499157.1 invasion associated locus B family protein [Alphaproteobacteria bacterium]
MKSVGIRFAGLVVSLIAFSLLATPDVAAPAASAPAQADANKPVQPDVTQEFGDWTVRCYPVSSPAPCEMLEMLVNKKTGRRVLGVVLVYNTSNSQHVMQIALPLGVMLQNGAVLSSDTFTSDVMHFRLCDVQGCYVVAPLDDSAVDQLGKATKAEMQIVSVDGKKFNIAFSLKGFTAAHNSLVQLARQKAAGSSSSTSSDAQKH